MACVRPLTGWHSGKLTANGKPEIVFEGKRVGDMLLLPCGRCIGCRLEYGRSWAVRCMHEASLHEENVYGTITYDDDHLPEGGTLVKKDCQDFMKRLRSRFHGRKIRFFLSGEYGGEKYRPHYHFLLFGFDFPDKVFQFHRQGRPVWNSDILEEIWSKGFGELGEVTFESAAYCAKYILDKFKGTPEMMKVVYEGLEPEFALMSRGRRPDGGIGYRYYAKHGKEIHEHDSVIVNGKEQKPPRYYDLLFEEKSATAFNALKEERLRGAELFAEKDGRGSSRLACEEALMKSRVELRKVKKK